MNTEATQMLEVEDQSDENEDPNPSEMDVVAGHLVVNAPDQSPELHPLHLGMNIIGRQSTARHRDQDRLGKWKDEYQDRAVHGVFLNSTGVSATHAAIFLEARGSFCFVKDLGSRNKTFFLKNAKQVPLKGDDRYTAASGSYIKLGALECRIEFASVASYDSSTHAQPSATAAAEQDGSIQEGSGPTHGSPAATDKVDATPELEDPGDEAASLDLSGRPAVEQTQITGGKPANQLAAATQLGLGLYADEQNEDHNQDLVLGTLVHDHVQLGEDAEDPSSIQPGQPHTSNTATGPNSAAPTDASDLDTVWQPELTADEAQGIGSPQEINSPHAALRAPSLQPDQHSAEPQRANAACPQPQPSQAAQHSALADSDRTIASTPSDLGDRAGLDEVQSNEGGAGPPPPAEAALASSRKASQATDQDTAVAAPRRRKLPQRGAGLVETQLPDSQAVRNSMSEAGHIAAMFPATEVDPGNGIATNPESGDEAEAADNRPAAARKSACRSGRQPIRGQEPASQTPDQSAEPPWLLGGTGTAAVAKEASQAEKPPASTTVGLKTWSRRSRGTSEQDTAAAAATAPQHGSVEDARKQASAAAQRQAVKPRRDAFDFPDSATPLEASAVEKPAMAAAPGSGRGRGRGRAAGKDGRGKAAAKSRQQPSRRASTDAQAAEALHQFQLPEAAAHLQAGGNDEIVSKDLHQDTSFKAGSETQAAAHGLKKLADSSERPAGSGDPISKAPSPPVQTSHASAQPGRKGRSARRTSGKQQEQASASPELQADGGAASLSAAPAADARKAAVQGKSAQPAASQVPRQQPVSAEEPGTLADGNNAQQDAAVDAGSHLNAEEQLTGDRRPAVAARSNVLDRVQPAEPSEPAAGEQQHDVTGTPAARGSGRAAHAARTVGPARQRPSRGRAARQASMEPSPEAEAGSAGLEADAAPENARAAKGRAGVKRKGGLRGDKRSASPAPTPAAPVEQAVGRGRGKAGKQPALEQATEASAEPQPAAAARAKTAAGRRASTRQAKLAQSKSPSAEPEASAQQGPASLTHKDSSAEGLLAEATEDSLRRAGKRKASTESLEPARAATTGARKLRKTDQKQVKVLFSTCLNAALRKILSKAVQQLGGTVAKDGPDFTHFVTLQAARGHNDRGFKKSLNTLIAVAAGRPIVTDGWVDASAVSDAWVDPRMHLLEDTAAEEALSFNLAASYQRASHNPLLANLSVFLSPGLVAAEDNGAEGLKTLISQAGGQIANAAPSKAGLADCLVLGADKDIKKERSWAVRHLPKGTVVHTRGMLVDAILRQALDKRHGILFTA